METVFFILTGLFFATTLWLARQVVYCAGQKWDEELSRVIQAHDGLLSVKEEVIRQKMILENEANKIFTLYDMTREVAQKLHEDEAFVIFRSKLQANVRFTECRLLDTHDPEIKNFKRSEDAFLFTLSGEKKRLGYILFQGVPPEDRDKAMILSHQFALALRRVKLAQEIERLAITDSLTGVHTRRHFMERFEEELKRSKLRNIPLSVIMVDVDFFKEINDRHGHLAGDHILREIAAIIRESIRGIDIAGRYGGEEFCVVLPDTDQPGGIFAAERLRSAVEKTPIKAYDTVVSVTVSIGLASFPKDAQTGQELMDKADWALYRAKKNGRNCVCAFGVYQ